MSEIYEVQLDCLIKICRSQKISIFKCTFLSAIKNDALLLAMVLFYSLAREPKNKQNVFTACLSDTVSKVTRTQHQGVNFSQCTEWPYFMPLSDFLQPIGKKQAMSLIVTFMHLTNQECSSGTDGCKMSTNGSKLMKRTNS